jgi:hypothetical protein
LIGKIIFSLILSSLIFNSVAYASSSIKIITNSPLVYTSPNNNCNAEICIELLSLINNSKQTIDFAIYGLRGQDEILNAGVGGSSPPITTIFYKAFSLCH